MCIIFKTIYTYKKSNEYILYRFVLSLFKRGGGVAIPLTPIGAAM